MDVIQNLLGVISSWSPVAILPVISIFMAHLIKEIKKNQLADEKRSDEVKAFIKAEIKSLETRIAYLEASAVLKTDYYRDMGGWRTELGSLSEMINTHYTDVMDKFIELWKESRN